MSGNLLYNSDIYRFPAACIMLIDIVLVSSYFIYFQHLNIFKLSMHQQKINESYSEDKMVPPLLIGGTWRKYELIHIGFWILKDYCWSSGDKLLWLVGATLTLIMACHFIFKLRFIIS